MAASLIQDDPKAIFIAQLAHELHRAGVDSDQLEKTISATARVLGLEIEIFALPTNVTIAVGPRYAQRIVMLRLDPGRVNLRKLAFLNELFDELQTNRIDLDRAIAQLRQIDKLCPSPPALRSIFALACVALGVAVLLGGGVNELAVAGLIGAATGILSFFTQRNQVMYRLFEVIAAFVATLIVAAYSHWIAPVNLYISIVAGVVVLLPGYSLTLALNELANQDLIAGTARLGRVFAILLTLGCGAFLGFSSGRDRLCGHGGRSPASGGAAVLGCRRNSSFDRIVDRPRCALARFQLGLSFEPRRPGNVILFSGHAGAPSCAVCFRARLRIGR